MANRKSVKFHIKENDYFGSLATVLDLMRQDIEKEGHKPEYNKLLKRLRDELLYLQSSHKIVGKLGKGRN